MNIPTETAEIETVEDEQLQLFNLPAFMKRPLYREAAAFNANETREEFLRRIAEENGFAEFWWNFLLDQDDPMTTTLSAKQILNDWQEHLLDNGRSRENLEP